MAKFKAVVENSESRPNQDIDEGTADGAQASKVSRRRALIVGLAAAPAILSLMNRSAWGQQNAIASCNLVSSYANAGYKWTSPRPANNNGTLSFTVQEYNDCGIPPDPNP